MSTQSLTLTISDSLAQELDSVSEGLLIELLERGLREFKIEQALDRYVRGGISFGAAAAQAVCPNQNSPGMLRARDGTPYLLRRGRRLA